LLPARRAGLKEGSGGKSTVSDAVVAIADQETVGAWQ
jgi:hypothetical protein